MLFESYDRIEEVKSYKKTDFNPQKEQGTVTVKMPFMELKGKNAIVCITGTEGYPEGHHAVAIYGRMDVIDLFKALMAISKQVEAAMEELAGHLPAEAAVYKALRQGFDRPPK